MNNSWLFWAFMLGLPLFFIISFSMVAGRLHKIPRTGISPFLQRITLYKNFMIILLIAVSGSLYLYLGRPDLATSSSRPMAPNQLETLIQDLKSYLEKNPSDIRALYLLADSYRSLGNYPLAEEYYKKLGEAAEAAHILLPAEYNAIYAEIRIHLYGLTDPIAGKFLHQTLTLESTNIRARFYLALIRAENGEKQAALNELQKLAHEIPTGTPWANAIQEQLKKLSFSTIP